MPDDRTLFPFGDHSSPRVASWWASSRSAKFFQMLTDLAGFQSEH